MTLNTTESKIAYAGDGATTVFAIPFRFLANADIEAVLRDDATGVDAPWAEGTQFTLSGAGNDAGGSLTVETSPTDFTPALGETLVIRRAASETQGAAFPAGGAFPSKTVETALDRLTMLVQQHSEEIARAIVAPATDPSDALGSLPSSVVRGSKFLAFDAAGRPIAAAGTSADLAPVSAFMNDLLDDADAAAGRATLGVAGNGNSVRGIADKLELYFETLVKNANYTLSTADRGKVIASTASNSWTLSLPAAATAGAGFWFAVRNDGDGDEFVIDPNGSETIDGATTKLVGVHRGYLIVTDGTSWYSLGDVSGPWRATEAITGNLSLTNRNLGEALMVDAGGGVRTLTLPISGNPPDGVAFFVKKIDSSSNAVVVAGDASHTIDGLTSVSLLSQGDFVEVVWLNGAEHYQIVRQRRRFQSAEQTITANAIHTVAHQLGVLPRKFGAVLRCKTAELGFAVGDEVTVGNYAGADTGFECLVDAGNAMVIAATTLSILRRNATIGASTGITAGNWRLVLRAEA